MAKKKSGSDKENQPPNGNKCTWSQQDDEVLLRVLQSEKAAGNQSQNGWKAQVWNTVVAALEKEGLLGTPPKTTKKIQDHYANLKNDFTEVRSLRNLSGFGWDDGTSRVVVTEEVWGPYLKAHAKASKWKKKTFIHYDAMAYLVDGIIATGAGAFNPGETPASSPAPESLSAATTPTSGSDDIAPAVQPEAEDLQEDTPPTAPPTAPSGKRQRAESDSPSPPRRARPLKRAKKDQKDEAMTNALLAISQAFQQPDTSQDVDYHAKAIELLEDDGDLSDNEMVQAFSLMDKNTNISKTFCTIRRKPLRTSYIQRLIYDTN